MIPKRIYLREADFDDLLTGERMVSCDEPFNDLNVEYTDLSQIWHDASEEPKDANWDILYQDEDDCCWTEDMLTAQLRHGDWNGFTEGEKVVRWAYISGLLPKGGNDED